MYGRKYLKYGIPPIIVGFLLFIIPKLVEIDCLHALDTALLTFTLFVFASITFSIYSKRQIHRLYNGTILSFFSVIYMVLLMLRVWEKSNKACKVVDSISTFGIILQAVFIFYVISAEVRFESIYVKQPKIQVVKPDVEMTQLELPTEQPPIRKLHMPFKVKVLYTYFPQSTDELTLMKGEVIDILDNSGKWWKARKKEGVEGIVPSNYLEIIEEPSLERRLSF